MVERARRFLDLKQVLEFPVNCAEVEGKVPQESCYRTEDRKGDIKMEDRKDANQWSPSTL